VDDGRGDGDLLHLVVEIKGYRREDAKEKKATMDTYWVPAVNNLRTLGRWAFAELTEIYQIDADFKARWTASSTRYSSGPPAPRPRFPLDSFLRAQPPRIGSFSRMPAQRALAVRRSRYAFGRREKRRPHRDRRSSRNPGGPESWV